MDGVQVKQHSLRDQIEADKYLAGKDGRAEPGQGVRSREDRSAGDGVGHGTVALDQSGCRWRGTSWAVQGKAMLAFACARFDSAQTTPDNRKHWANADHLSADAAASPEVRRTLRNRARYEVANNSYARGIVLTLANDVIGTGPRLQMLLGDGLDDAGDQPTPNQTIEREFAAWAKAIDLPGKLRTMRQARAQDGEAFALLFNNGNLDSPVKLDIRLIEADQVTTPGLLRTTP